MIEINRAAYFVAFDIGHDDAAYRRYKAEYA